MLKNRNPDVRGKTFECFDSHVRVPVFIQFGTPHGDTEFARDDGYHASSDTAFARHSYTESELPGFVVETAGQHECAKAFRAAHGEDILVVVRVGPVVG